MNANDDRSGEMSKRFKVLSRLSLYFLPSIVAFLWVKVASVLRIDSEIAEVLLFVWLAICVLLAFNENRIRYGNVMCAIPIIFAMIWMVASARSFGYVGGDGLILLVVWISICFFLILDKLRKRYGKLICVLPSAMAFLCYVVSLRLIYDARWTAYCSVWLTITFLLLFKQLRTLYGNWIWIGPLLIEWLWLTAVNCLHFNDEIPYLMLIAWLSVGVFIFLNQVRLQYGSRGHENFGLKVGYFLGAIVATVYFASSIVVR